MTGVGAHDSMAGNRPDFLSDAAAQERDALLQSKQVELNQILSRHDDLVRERFHLDRYKLLVSFDYKVAKADQSEALQKFVQENGHDLLQDAPIASSSTSGLTTRRARQRATAVLQSTPAYTHGSRFENSSPKDGSISSIWDVLTGGKPFKKGYGKQATPLRIDDPAYAPTPVAKSRKHSRPATGLDASIDAFVPPRKRRKTDHDPTDISPDFDPVPILSSGGRRKSHQRQPPAKGELDARPLSSIKRVRLIVHTPEPCYSCPAQKPAPRIFGGSLDAALASFSSADIQEEQVRAKAHALVRESVWKMRRRGRMLLSAEEVEALIGEEEVVVGSIVEGESRKGWDFLLEDVRLRRKERNPAHGPQVSAEVAAKVRGYWEARSALKARERLADERRLRGLAKVTMKLVLGEWKRAVYHLREHDRLERQELEKRLGREHLDAILDQSGQLLQSQQLDLDHSGRTRSTSPTSSLAGTGDDEETEYQSAIPTSVLDTACSSTVLLSLGSPVRPSEHDGIEQPSDEKANASIPHYLKPYACAPVGWDPNSIIRPTLLRGTLRPYQQAGLEWLASLHTKNLNGILADEMGLGKTIQTISLLAHLAHDRGIWGPHLVIVPTSVLLNWEMEFKKFLPGFRVVAYHGSPKRRKELRKGWSDKYAFNVCITSYTLASRDAHIFKRKPWYYMILDEAHMIKNFRSQRWSTLLMFRSFFRLLLTGTPLQNNLTELWALLQFLMSGTDFANLKEFGEWFSNPLEKAIEKGTHNDEETLQRVTKLHTLLRPYLLRRLKRDVEKELPNKYEHLVFCSLSKRQRFLYDEFMSRAQTRADLSSGVYQKIANVLMQLRKVCNHPDLFEVRPVVTSFAVQRAAFADFEIKEFVVRRRLLQISSTEQVDLELLRLRFSALHDTSEVAATRIKQLDGTEHLPFDRELGAPPPPHDTRTVGGFKCYREYQQRAVSVARWAHIAYINRLRCASEPVISRELIATVRRMTTPLLPASNIDLQHDYLNRVLAVNQAIKSFEERADIMAPLVDRFAFVTPAAVVPGLSHYAFKGAEGQIVALYSYPRFDASLHRAAVKLQVGFPDRALLQYDCGKLQRLAELLKTQRTGGHRVLVFTQMTRILDILEQFLTFHGWLYLRLDGGTKIEDRHYITELFNSDPRIFCFIASSRTGGIGINLTGADTVVFYDSDYNPQLDRQCEDRAHRIGQIRDVHIYRFISQHTVEEAMLLKVNQKRSLDDLVIQKGEFDWRTLFSSGPAAAQGDGMVRALEDFADREDAKAAQMAAQEVVELEGADQADFGEEERESADVVEVWDDGVAPDVQEKNKIDMERGSTAEYMLAFIRWNSEHFAEWRV